MLKAKKIISVFMIVLMVVSMFSFTGITASAAKTSESKVVSYNVLSGGTVSKITKTYTISGNWLSKKKITVLGKNNFPNKTTLNSFSALARFDITVKNAKGNTIATYNNKALGFNFRLPAWSRQKYKITVTSKFVGYNIGNTYHQSAALTGKYYLKH